MKKIRFSRCFFGLLLIGILTLFVLEFHRSSLEADLKNRSQIALNKAGLNKINVRFSGRDAILSGAPGYRYEDMDKATKLLEQVYGIRSVKNTEANLPLKFPYRWMAVREKDRIKLKAFVPSEEARITILGFAQASLPTVEIVDKMELAKGAPAQDVWLGGVSFGLKQADLLRKGRIYLAGTKLSIKGVAKDAESYELLQKTMLEKMPTGIELEKVKIRPPKVKPYVWSIKLNDTQIVLSGYVPNQKMKNHLLQLIEQTFPHLPIVDGMRFASGSPKNWEQVVRLVAQQFSLMKKGEIVISGKTIKISGTVSDQQTAFLIKNTFASLIPKDFDLENEIKVYNEKKTELLKGLIFAYEQALL